MDAEANEEFGPWSSAPPRLLYLRMGFKPFDSAVLVSYVLRDAENPPITDILCFSISKLYVTVFSVCMNVLRLDIMLARPSFG